MTIRRKNWAVEEVLTEADLELYAQDNGVIQCSAVSELASMPSTVNTAFVTGNQTMYVKTSGSWRAVPVLGTDGKLTVNVPDPSVSTQPATKNYVDSLSAKPTVTNSPPGTSLLKVYHNSLVGPLVLFSVYRIYVPVPAGANNPVIQATAGDSVAGLNRGQSLRVLSWEPANNRAVVLWTDLDGNTPAGATAGASVRVNYTVHYNGPV